HRPVSRSTTSIRTRGTGDARTVAGSCGAARAIRVAGRAGARDMREPPVWTRHANGAGNGVAGRRGGAPAVKLPSRFSPAVPYRMSQRPVRILTGITTSGTPHLGNYVGAIRPAIAASRAPGTESFYFLA